MGVDLGRGQGSHVTVQGFAKRAYTLEEAEREAAHLRVARRVPYFPYLCGQRPEHYHLSASVSDLVPDGYTGRHDSWLRPGEARGWSCGACGAWALGKPHHDRCPACRSPGAARAGVSECYAGATCRSVLHRRDGPQGVHVRAET